MLQPGAFWNGRKYHLDRMTLRELVQAYFAYPAIQVYLTLGILSGVAGVAWAQSPLPAG